MFGKTKKLVMCQSCRGLIDSSLRTCPLCGRDSVPDAPARVSAATQHSQFFTMLVLGITVVIYVLMTAVDMSGGASGSAFVSGASAPVSIDFGAMLGQLVRAGQWWRLVTAIFLHAGILHLGFNCFALYQIGPLAEEAYGSQKFIFIYLLTGIAGNVVSMVYMPNGFSVGASGAIMGLIGLAAVYGYKIGGMGGRALTRQMIIWVIVILVFGMVVQGVDNAAHIGGLAAGALAGYLMKPEQPITARAENFWNATAVGCVVVIAACFVMVGLRFGDQQKSADTIVLDKRIRKLGTVLYYSSQWHGPNDGDPAKIAADLRSAASDLESVKNIDSRVDSIKNQFADLAKQRAALFDNASKDPTGPANAAAKDASRFGALFDQYQSWFDSVKDQYGLRFTRGSPP